MPVFDTVAIVGVGLIGGSIGLALRERKMARQIIGIGHRLQSLQTAQEVGAIDVASTDVEVGVKDADFVVVCTPVDAIATHVQQVANACPPTATITDAGSTKAEIVGAVDRYLGSRRDGPCFVGSHPIAGDHRTGPAHARGELFAGRVVVVTPTSASDNQAVECVDRFWTALGARVIKMPADEHDAALAATSHLPHLIAAALAGATPTDLLPLTAGGWRDTTRVAGGNPHLWRAIFATNRQPVLDALQRFDERLTALRAALSDKHDAHFEQLLLDAKRTRDALGD